MWLLTLPSEAAACVCGRGPDSQGLQGINRAQDLLRSCERLLWWAVHPLPGSKKGKQGWLTASHWLWESSS